MIAVPLPDVRGRNQILQHHMKEVVTAQGQGRFATFLLPTRSHRYPDVDPSILARGTPGFSGADLHNMVKCECSVAENRGPSTDIPLAYVSQAAIQASKEGSKAVTLKHFEWAKVR